jgi:N-acetyl-1-D-myo-inositol-2-amino-2-deoxy-alpha-D-glucopyranoside deacetylase
VIAEGLQQLKDAPNSPFATIESVEDVPFALSDELVTTRIDAEAFVDAKADALAAHATQISTDGPFFALSNNVGQRTWGTEYYRLVRGTAGGPLDDQGRETDLFGGIRP